MAYTGCPRLRLIGLPLTKFQTYLSKLPNSRLTSKNAIALLTAEVDLQTVSDNSFVSQQRSDLLFVVRGDLFEIETIESFAVVVSLAQDCFPTQSSLRAFKNQKFKQNLVIMLWQPPLFVVVGDRITVSWPSRSVSLIVR
mgnify:CR=1 FL=1